MAVWSGGCSGSGEVVPAILFASREKEKAHELLGIKRNRKHSLARYIAHWNSAAMERVPRRRFRPELEKNRESERLGEAGSAPGRALGSQEGGGDGGALGSLGKGSREVNFTVARV
jgi:hypothetical protein